MEIETRASRPEPVRWLRVVAAIVVALTVLEPVARAQAEHEPASVAEPCPEAA